jgi:hypothetical protein
VANFAVHCSSRIPDDTTKVPALAHFYYTLRSHWLYLFNNLDHNLDLNTKTHGHFQPERGDRRHQWEYMLFVKTYTGAAVNIIVVHQLSSNTFKGMFIGQLSIAIQLAQFFY